MERIPALELAVLVPGWVPAAQETGRAAAGPGVLVGVSTFRSTFTSSLVSFVSGTSISLDSRFSEEATVLPKLGILVELPSGLALPSLVYRSFIHLLTVY